MKAYIQIGSNSGHDDFFRKVSLLKEPSKIILVEPNSSLINDLTSCYKELSNFHSVIILNKGVTEDSTLNTLVLYDHHGFSSVISRKTHPKVTGTMQFEPITFEQLCKETNIDKEDIEELHIDTEGYDYTILNLIDFSQWKIKKVYAEVWPHDEDSTTTIKTGPLFFKETILPKMNLYYSLHEETMDLMPTHVFERLKGI